MTNSKLPEGIPPELGASAKTLSGELAWPADEALKAIDWLSSQGFAILGVEMWRERNGSPIWIASSSYSYDDLAQNWLEYVRICAEGACGFVQKFASEQNALFNLTWTEKTNPET